MKHRVLIAACLTMAMASAQAADSAGPPPADKPPPPAKPLPISLARLTEAAQTALATCKAAGWPVGLTVVDADLTVRLILRDEGAGASAAEVSHRKAYTAMKMGMSSDDYSKSLSEADITYPSAEPGTTRRGEPGVRNGDPMLLPKAGGVPMVLNGRLVGAMGVSGRPAGKDVDCVMAGLEKIGVAAK